MGVGGAGVLTGVTGGAEVVVDGVGGGAGGVTEGVVGGAEVVVGGVGGGGEVVVVVDVLELVGRGASVPAFQVVNAGLGFIIPFSNINFGGALPDIFQINKK